MKVVIVLGSIACLALTGCWGNSAISPMKNSTYAQSTTDQDISTRVLEAIKYDSGISLQTKNSIQVSTVDGVVTLSGTALSNRERDAVIKAAHGVSGVKRVHSKITLIK